MASRAGRIARRQQKRITISRGWYSVKLQLPFALEGVRVTSRLRNSLSDFIKSKPPIPIRSGVPVSRSDLGWDEGMAIIHPLKPAQRATKISIHLRWKAAPECRDDSAGHFIGFVRRVVEFEIGDGAGRRTDVLPVHAANDTDERSRSGEDVLNVRFLIGNFGPITLNKTHIVCARFQAQLPEPSCVEDPIRGRFNPVCPRLIEASDQFRLGSE
jgi:hypothetical protein